MSLPTFAPEAAIAATAVLYTVSVWRRWSRAGWGHGTPVWRAACFLGGMLVLSAALAGPMDDLADQSFAAHMFQHVLLMKVIPPLLLLGEFSVVFLYAAGSGTAHQAGQSWVRSPILRSAWRKLTSPWLAWSFFAFSLWIWHAPPFYQAALSNEWLHVLEHATFFTSSLLFWWFILQPGPNRAARYGAVVLYLFTALLHESALGALLTFSTKAWYPFYSGAAPWRLSALADQQVAGLIMWIPGGLLFGFLMVGYFGAWLSAIEKRLQAMHPEYAPYPRAGERHD